ncbi:MAG: hypothetical protein HY913_10135 [Desulfomonile tiedjei]|nr:hypothetical protein [Desulfomonile tiedjei]
MQLPHEDGEKSLAAEIADHIPSSFLRTQESRIVFPDFLGTFDSACSPGSVRLGVLCSRLKWLIGYDVT